jgi:hypothetical protein
MAASTEDVRRLRRMMGDREGQRYTDADLAEAIESHPTVDTRGTNPTVVDYTTNPPTRRENPAWMPVYDLNAAAAELWEERASELSGNFDFRTDAGEQFSRSQAFEHAQERARHFRARRVPGTMTAAKYPREGDLDNTPWIGNLPERDEEY